MTRQQRVPGMSRSQIVAEAKAHAAEQAGMTFDSYTTQDGPFGHFSITFTPGLESVPLVKQLRQQVRDYQDTLRALLHLEPALDKYRTDFPFPGLTRDWDLEGMRRALQVRADREVFEKYAAEPVVDPEKVNREAEFNRDFA